MEEPSAGAEAVAFALVLGADDMADVFETLEIKVEPATVVGNAP